MGPSSSSFRDNNSSESHSKMSIPQQLAEKIAAASDALDKNPQGELRLHFRRQIWAALGPHLRDNENQPRGTGWRRRTRLAILCVQHILPLWQNAFTRDDRPEQMLAMAEKLLKGEQTSEEALKQQNEFFAELGDIPDEQLPSACTGYASVQAVTVAAVDQDDDDTLDETDQDLDAYMWDSSYYASMAAANGDSSLPDSSISRRRDFWRWWLDQAVPQAYLSIPD